MNYAETEKVYNFLKDIAQKYKIVVITAQQPKRIPSVRCPTYTNNSILFIDYTDLLKTPS